MRINGYYYSFAGNDKWNGPTYTIYVFYRNGVFLNESTSGDIALQQEEERFASASYNSSNKNVKYIWGAFLVNGDNIQIERWLVKRCNPTESFNATILNDTTFVQLNTNDTFHFKQFSPKPDSTNSFIN